MSYFIKWSIFKMRGDGDWSVQMSELAFFDTQGQRIEYPSGTTVTTDFTTYSGEGPMNIIDNNSNTKLCGAWGRNTAYGGGVNITVEMPTDYVTSRAVAYKYCTGGDAQARDPVCWILWYSDDGENWQVVDIESFVTITTSRRTWTQAFPYSILPGGLYQVAYIRNCKATQYIDTDFNPNQDTRVVMQVQNSFNSAYWFGAWNVAYNDGAYACCADNIGIYSGYDGQGSTIGSAPTGTVNIDMDKNVVKLNNSVHRTFEEAEFQVDYPLYLFGQNRAGVFTTHGAAGVLYKECDLVSCQIYDDGTLIRNFVPCFDAYRGVAGLYDKANRVFYDAQGTNIFYFGPVTEKLDTYYLIEDTNNNIYTVVNGELTNLGQEPITSSLFQAYGMLDVPTWDVMSSLVNPKVIQHQVNATEQHPFRAVETATPPLQILITDDYDMTDYTILGIEDADVVASDDVLFAISTDQGVTWKAHNGTMWVTLSSSNSGMNAEAFNNIDVLDWAEIYTGNSTIRLRAILPSLTSYIESVIINYIN